MKSLLIALMTIGLLGASPLALADPDRNESGFLKAHDRHDGHLSRGTYREHPGHRGRGHHKHRRHHKKGPKWHHRDRHHDHRYRGDRRRHHDGYNKHRHYRDRDRHGSFFGIADGDRGVLIWKK
ncbi:hypothetical protein [Marinobacter sp.]|uniref:hypothetical protein n=1 Tax=Marinobacter sp. TaxID=50741 RepID=UPI00356243F0